MHSTEFFINMTPGPPADPENGRNYLVVVNWRRDSGPQQYTVAEARLVSTTTTLPPGHPSYDEPKGPYICYWTPLGSVPILEKDIACHALLPPLNVS